MTLVAGKTIGDRVYSFTHFADVHSFMKKERECVQHFGTLYRMISKTDTVLFLLGFRVVHGNKQNTSHSPTQVPWSEKCRCRGNKGRRLNPD